MHIAWSVLPERWTCCGLKSAEHSLARARLKQHGARPGNCACAGAAKQKKAEMDELLVPPDLPIEMIAEEVKESWRLKEVHVEKLMQKVGLPCYTCACVLWSSRVVPS